ncbi:MAG: hypothetical protein A2X94_14160 [Bdellovibrionales bacterium GWB1_55_8]|nr:MAG: hypothetical protein A2X94_14160 [Bdellovibrionales bacterium GWB1_55_8]
MTFQRFIFTAAAILSAVSGLSAAAVEINPELQQVEKALEAKVQDKLHSLYGDDLKIAVSIHGVPFAQKPKAGAGADADMGYAPFASDFLDGDPESLVQAVLSLEAIEVDIQAPEELDDAFLNSVKNVVELTLKGMAPKVSISRVPTPKKLDASMFRSIDWKFAITLIAVLMVALILTVGVGLSLKSSANAIAEGLRSGNSSTIENKTDLTLNGATGGESGKKSEPQVPAIPPEKDYDRNVGIVREVLVENPLLLAQSLRDEDSEWQGLRSLLPSLGEEERVTLKKALGARVSRLVSDDVAGGAGTVNGAAWLRDFVERLMLRKVQGGSEVERTLGVNSAIVLSLSNHKSLLAAALAVDNRGAWRILTEFYPKSQMGSLFKEVSESQWWTIVSSVEATAQEVTDAASKMIELIQQSPLENESRSEKSRFYKSHLVAPMVNYIKSVEFGRDDTLLDDLNKSSPDLAVLVREKVWTASQLELVPDDYLKRVLRDATYEQRAALIAVLPQNQASRIEALLPEGNIRTITVDQARRIKLLEAVSPERKHAVESVRKFIDYLRQQAANGKFVVQGQQLDSGSTGYREAA